MGWAEWPLVAFTVLAQTATGAFWWCCAALLVASLAPDQAAHLENLMAVIWVMVAVAFGAASFHLGRPLRAVNASFRLGRAPMSNEVVLGSVFAGLGVLGWLMGMVGLGAPTLRLTVLGLTVLASFAFLASMTAFYLMPTVPTWNTPLTPAAFLVTAILGGSPVAATMFAAAGIAPPGILAGGPVSVAGLALVAAVVVTLLQSARLPRINSSIKRAIDLAPHYAVLMAIRFVILFVAMGFWGLALSRAGALPVAAGIACSILVIAGELIGRSVHFGLHMTVGLR
jgi:DMSO reductase anchor subunit